MRLHGAARRTAAHGYNLLLFSGVAAAKPEVNLNSAVVTITASSIKFHYSHCPMPKDRYTAHKMLERNQRAMIVYPRIVT